MASATAKQLRKLAAATDLPNMYAVLGELPEPLLDILAYDLKVDWYDYDAPVRTKAQTLKTSIDLHRHMGTKYAVETGLSVLYGGAKVEEWFEYGGEPYTFRVKIHTNEAITGEKHIRMLQNIELFQNLRSHLSGIRYEIKPKPAEVATGAFCATGARMKVLPFFAKELVAPPATAHTGVFALCARRIDVMPFLADKTIATATARIGVFALCARHINVMPLAAN